MIEGASQSPWQFELFILHAAPDAAFVHGYLLRALGLDEADPRVMLPSRFALGHPILDELARAIEGSRFTVLVVSRATAADDWSEVGRILATTLAASGAQRLIPLQLEDITVPLTLRALVSLEFRHPADWHDQAAKLRRLLAQPAPRHEVPACPYPGLEPFRRHDAGRFFGREDQVRKLAREIEAGNRRICVIGPSGSGKSSLVQAGVLPKLERGSAARSPWLVRSVRATEEPCARLTETLNAAPNTALNTAPNTAPNTALPGATPAAVTALLTRAGCQRLVVFIDQLEELFTLASSAERERFPGMLRALTADPRCAVLVALRADFFGSLMESELWGLFDGGRFHVTPLGPSELRRAIEEPARQAGVYLEAALTQRLVSDTAAEPGALPLLQATMLELWDGLEDRVRDGAAGRYLTLHDYEQLSDGGTTAIATALARRANAAIHHMPADQQAIARRLLLSLVAFGDNGRHTRRQQRLATLRAAEDPERFDDAVATLVTRRLLTTDHAHTADGRSEPTIDLSHEALITAWPELRSWIERDRRDEERRRALSAKVAEWRELGDAKLLDAVELLDAERWLDSDGAHAGRVPGLRELVEHSRAALDAVRRQRDEAHRLLARTYQEHGRQLLLEGRPMRALPYLVAARRADAGRGVTTASAALRLLFAEAARSLPIAAVAHRAAIARAVLSPDGTRVATASRDGRVLVWCVATGEVSARLDHPDAVLDVAFHPDGTRLVTGGADHLARVWVLASGTLAQAPLAHGDRVHLVRFSPTGTRLATASWDRKTRLWDVASGELLGSPIDHQAIITRVQFHPAGHQIVVAGKHREARVHDLAGGLRHVLGHGEIVRSAEFSPDGARIVTASSDRTARVWDAVSGASIASLAHAAPVGGAWFSPGGDQVVTISEDGARIWDAGSGAAASPILRHADRVVDAVFSADGRRVVTASWDRSARIWDAASGAPWPMPFEHTREVLSAAFSLGDRCVVTTSADGTAHTWNASSGLYACTELAHAGKWVGSVAFDVAGQRVISAGADRTARIWSVATGDLIAPALAHSARVTAASFSPDGAYALTISANTATLWDSATGERRAQLDHARSASLTSAAFSSEGARVVTAGNDGVVKIWSATSGQLLDALSHPRSVTFARFSPDGTRIVSACADGHARIWHGAGAHCLAHDDTVSHAAFDRTGDRIVTASKDHTARLWDVASGGPRGSPIRHAGPVTHVAFSPDGTRIVTLSGNTVRLWDARSLAPALDPLEHRGRVLAIEQSHDGALLAVALEDGNAWIWDLDSGKPLRSPLSHPARVNDVAFGPSGTWLATASGDSRVRLWQLMLDDRSLADWSALADRCPFDLLDGILVERSIVESSSIASLTAGVRGGPRGSEASSLPEAHGGHSRLP